MIQLRVLGPIELEGPDGREQRAVLAQPKRLALLTHLAVGPRGFRRRDSLLALFWPDLDEAHARDALNQAIRFLRRDLGDAVLPSRGAAEIGVDPSRIWCDAVAFRDAIAAGDFAEALALYRGDFLTGFFAEAAVGFDEWRDQERNRLRSEAAHAARAVAESSERDQRFTMAVASAKRAVELSDGDERMMREHLELLDRVGDRSGAIKAYEAFARRLSEEFDTSPAAETVAVIERIRERSHMNGSPAAKSLSAESARQVASRTAARPIPDSGFRIRRTRIGAIIAVAVVALSAGAFVALRSLGRAASSSLLAPGRLHANEPLLVTDFYVAGMDSSMRRAVGFATRAALTQSSSISIVAPEAVAAALMRMGRPPNSLLDLALARQIAAREGIRGIVDGHVIRTGNRLDIGLRLVSTDSGSELATFRSSVRDLDEVTPALDRLTRQLRRRVGESLARIRESPPLPQVTTHSLEALRLYAEGNSETDFQRALVLLKQAVKADSEFAEAWRKLAVTYGNLRLTTSARDTAALNAYRYRGKLPPRERLRIEAWYAARSMSSSYDRARAVEAHERLLALNDSNYALINLAELLWRRREFARAESLDRATIRRVPNAVLGYTNLTQRQIELGKLDDAQATIELGLSRIPNAWALEWSKLRILYHRGQIDAFERALDSLRSLSNPEKRRTATAALRDVAVLRGRLKEWARLHAEARALNAAAGSQLSPLDEALDHADVDLLIRRDTAAAVRRLLGATNGQSLTRRDHLRVAELFAKAGRSDLSREAMTRYETLADTAWRRVEQPNRDRVHAWIALAEGHVARAVDEFRSSDLRPDGPADACRICLYLELGAAFDRVGQADSARAMYQQYVVLPYSNRLAEVDPVNLAPILRRLGELYESSGNRAQAIRYYDRFVELWKDADPELLPTVDRVKLRLALLRRPGT